MNTVEVQTKHEPELNPLLWVWKLFKGEKTKDLINQSNYHKAAISFFFGPPMAGGDQVVIFHGGQGQGVPILAAQTMHPQNIQLRPLMFQNKVVGWEFEAADATYLIIDKLVYSPPVPPDREAYNLFVDMDSILKKAGYSFHNVIRTWFFINNISDWYERFNKIRTDFFNSAGLTSQSLPASTGIGSSNSLRKHIIGYAIALKPKNPYLSIWPVASPLQCPATIYGSMFSRAIEIDNRLGHYLMISGTASIGRNGESLFAWDTQSQIEFTLDVVEAILNDRKMNWSHLYRGIAYLRHTNEIHIWKKCAHTRQIPLERILEVKADICRSELNFEIEIDAYKPNVQNHSI